MGVNQQTIANELGLSVATVSRSLQNHPAINPETKGRVLETAARLGYRRSPRNGRKAKTKLRSIGVFVITPTGAGASINPGHARFLSGISAAAEGMNFAPVVHYLDEDRARDLLASERQPPVLRQQALAGLIFLNRFPPDVVRGLSEQLPCVCLTHHARAPLADTVLSDADAGIGELIERLRNLGHRRIGFAADGDRTHLHYVHQRFAAYFESLTRLGLSYDPTDVSSLVPETVGVDFREHVIRQTQAGVTAWACASDSLGVQVLEALKGAGRRIPEDVSVIGYDGNNEELTSVITPWQEMGAQAVHLLQTRLDNPSRLAQTLCLYPAIHDGGSIGPVKETAE